MSSEEFLLRKIRKSIALISAITLVMPLIGACGGALCAFYFGKRDIDEARACATRVESQLIAHELQQSSEKAELTSMKVQVDSIDSRTKRIETFIDQTRSESARRTSLPGS